jgi:hypothetical protein
MGERNGTVRERAVVPDTGQWYDAGATARIERKPSERGQFRLTPDSRGDREVLECRRVAMNGRPMLVVTLRRA